MSKQRIQELQELTARISKLDISKLSESQLAERNTLINNIKEELTKIKEVSDKTLTSYLTKVDADSRKHEKDPTKRSPEKASKSVGGFARAFNKLDARKEKTDESLADDFMKMAQARGYNVRQAGTPDEERARTQQMVAQRAKERQEQEQQAAQADAANLPELKAKYEEMKKLYQSLGGSNWQYADREQNLSDAERKARSMEPELNRLAAQIHRAEQSQGVAEADQLPGTPVVSLSDFDDKDNKKNRYGQTVPKKLKKDDPRVKFHKEPEQKEVDEGYDKWGWHTSLTNGEFMPTKYGNKNYVYLHDLDNESPRGGAQLVTFNKPSHAKMAAAKFGGKVVKTDLNTYRVVKPAEQGVAEGSDELYQKAIRKYTQRVANDYLGGGNAHLYGAGNFDSEMFGVDPKQAEQDFDALFPQYLKKLQGGGQGVAEGMGEDSPVVNAITRRIMSQRVDLLSKYGPEAVGQAIDDVADYVGDFISDNDEIGTSDVSNWVRQVERVLSDSTGITTEAYDRLKKVFDFTDFKG
jgi:hypothetical protein